MDHDDIRGRVASMLSDNRTLHALRQVSRATLQAPPPNEYFVARLQKLLSLVARSGGIAVIETADSTYAVFHQGTGGEDAGFDIYNQGTQRHQWDVTRDQLVRFFIPLSGHVRMARLTSLGDGPTEDFIDALTPVVYQPPRFELANREFIC